MILAWCNQAYVAEIHYSNQDTLNAKWSVNSMIQLKKHFLSCHCCQVCNMQLKIEILSRRFCAFFIQLHITCNCMPIAYVEKGCQAFYQMAIEGLKRDFVKGPIWFDKSSCFSPWIVSLRPVCVTFPSHSHHSPHYFQLL